MLQTLKNAWRTKEIRAKIIFTLFILMLYRIGTVIPVPFVDANNFSSYFSGTILDQMNILSGNALGSATLFALGVSPYINASIIIQLLAIVFPRLGELAKTDKSKMNLITRIVTVILAIVTSIGYYFLLKNAGMLSASATPGEGKMAWLYGIVIVACYCAGASVIMWLAERINEKGIGNGISLILFANIISVIPSFLYTLGSLIVDTFGYSNKAWLFATVSIIFALILIAAVIAIIIFIIFVTGSERRINVKYAKQVKGRKMYGGQSQPLPIKLNMTGVMPVIFASSIVSLLPTILALCGVTSETKSFWGTVYRIFEYNGVVYPILFGILIIAFTYFYTQITFDPTEISNRIRSQGGTIMGYRPGRETADHIRGILNRVTIAGALFLTIIALVPMISGPHIIQHILEWIVGASDYATVYPSTVESTASSLTGTFTFGGTSLLIMVGVVLETFRELEAQLTMRNYKGFL